MRTSGLPTVNSFASPIHVLHFYQHGKELLDISASFCRAGLEDGDCCLWVTAPPWTATLALSQLVIHHPSAYSAAESGQIQFVPFEHWHVPEGQSTDHPMGILEKALVKISEAHKRGWTRVRVCGNALQPLPDREWERRLRYEAALHETIVHSDLVVLCSYRLQGIPETVRNGLMERHHGVLTNEQGRWHYAAIDSRK